MSQELVAVVSAAAKRSRPLHANRKRLAYDLAVLMSGARPCVMLDYAGGLDAESVVQLVLLANTNACLRVKWCVLSHDGCFYIASLPGLISHLGRLLQLQDHDPPAQPATSTAPDAHLDEASVKQYLPVLIAFKREEGSQGGLRPTRMTEQAAQAVFQRLAGLHSDLCNSPGVPLLTPSGQASHIIFIDLAPTMARLLQPTLNGLLLAYPVVYFVEGGLQEAAQASRCLSSLDLTLFEMGCVPPPALITAMGRAGIDTQTQQQSVGGSRKKKNGGQAVMYGHRGEGGRPADVVCSFTVPSCLLCSKDEGVDSAGQSVVQQIDAWAAQMERDLRASSFHVCHCVSSAVGTCSLSL